MEQDDDLFDEMVSNASEKINKKVEIDIEEALNEEFASDSDEDIKSKPKPKPKLIVVNKAPKRRSRGKKKANEQDGFEIVKEARVTTNKRKVGVHFYDNLK